MGTIKIILLKFSLRALCGVFFHKRIFERKHFWMAPWSAPMSLAVGVENPYTKSDLFVTFRT